MGVLPRFSLFLMVGENKCYVPLLIDCSSKISPVQWRTGLLKRRRMCSPPHPKGEKERGCNILVQAGRQRRTKVVIHVLRALKRTQNTQNMYKRIICGAAATCTGLLPLLFDKP